jgi:drug/metabolite transporter (DMT)-like permease
VTGSLAALGAVCALGSALTWTLISLLVRALSPYLNTVAINVVRSALGGLLLGVVVLLWAGIGPLRDLTPGAFAYLAASTVVAFGLGDSTFFESTKRLGLARALTISMMYPLIAAGLALLFLGEPITVQLGGGAVVTLTGLAIVVGDHAPTAAVEARPRARGIGLALLAAVAWAAGALLMKPPLGQIDPFTAQAVRLPLAAAVLWATPWARGAGRHLRAHARVAGPLVAALAVLTAASSVMFVAAVKYAGVGIATVLSSTAPLFALPIGLLAFGEPVTWRGATGAALCVAGITILTI